MSTRSPDTVPSGLIKMLENTERTRRSSATAAGGVLLASPQPQRELHAKIDSMSNDLRHSSIGHGSTKRNINLSSHRNPSFQSTGSHNRDQSAGTGSVASPDNQGVKISHQPRGSNPYQSAQNQDLRYSGRANMNSSNKSFATRQSSLLHSSSKVSLYFLKIIFTS